MILEENRLTNAVYQAGIPTMKAYDVVKTEDYLGGGYERLYAKDLIQCMKEDKEHLQMYAQRFGEFVRQAHQVKLPKDDFANNAEEKKQIAISYKLQTDIFANYLGESLGSVESEHILSVRNKMGASYPLMLYITKSKDKAKFMFISSFEADSYVKAMKTVLSENQIQ